MLTDPGYAAIDELAVAYRDGTTSPVEVCEALLDRAGRLNSSLAAFQILDTDGALAAARRAEAELRHGRDRGPLHGVPVAVKDLFATRGLPTQAGSRLLAGWTPNRDSVAVTRLRSAGAVLLGKLSLHEFAFGGPVMEGPFRTGRNPWNRDHLPGSSSSGSAIALAAGLVSGALGSDTGGSIRIPASFSGVSGLKPTFGRIPTAGVVPLIPSMDTVGPMARSARDCQLLFEAVVDARSRAGNATPPADDLTGWRVGVLRDFCLDQKVIAADVAACFEDALACLSDLGASLTHETFDLQDAALAIWSVFVAEAFAYHEPTLRTRPSEYTAALRHRLILGATYLASDLVRASELRVALTRSAEAALRRVDVLVTPATPTAAPPIAGGTWGAVTPAAAFTCAWNLAGLPAHVIPCGFTPDGLPVGLQIIGRRGAERIILRFAESYQRATDWHRRRPPLEMPTAS